MNDNEIICHKVGVVDVKHGRNFKIVEPVNIYSCVFGDNCFVGPFVEIQRNVVVGNHTSIQSHTFVCDKVVIGNNCFVAHGVMFINDLFKAGSSSNEAKDWLPTIIGNNVSIGSNSTILPVKICDNVVIGAGSVVVKNIVESGVYVGNPARLLRKLKKMPIKL